MLKKSKPDILFLALTYLHLGYKMEEVGLEKIKFNLLSLEKFF